MFGKSTVVSQAFLRRQERPMHLLLLYFNKKTNIDLEKMLSTVGDVSRFMIQGAHVGFLHLPKKIGISTKFSLKSKPTVKTLLEETTLLIRHFFYETLTRTSIGSSTVLYIIFDKIVAIPLRLQKERENNI
ncbi:MAG: hypothetical protein ACI8RD_002993 [Bacillariaceae sp.]|jgi:hypothetical protein